MQLCCSWLRTSQRTSSMKNCTCGKGNIMSTLSGSKNLFSLYMCSQREFSSDEPPRNRITYCVLQLCRMYAKSRTTTANIFIRHFARENTIHYSSTDTQLYWDIRWRVQVQGSLRLWPAPEATNRKEQKCYCACAILVLLSVSPWRDSPWDNLCARDGFTITSKCACCFLFAVVFCIPILGESDKWIVNHIRDKTKLKTGFMG